MNTKPDGGPAFPSTSTWYNDDSHQYELSESGGGMTLRDYFAAKAMTAFLSNTEFLVQVSQIYGQGAESASVSKAAYECADAMLKARKS